MDETYAGLPLKYWIVGGVAVLGVVWYFLRGKSSSSSSSNNSTPNQLDVATADGSNPSGVTDSNGVPWEDTWPYNQLALPYNPNPTNSNQVIDNIQYVSPQQPNYPGYNSSIVQAA